MTMSIYDYEYDCHWSLTLGYAYGHGSQNHRCLKSLPAKELRGTEGPERYATKSDCHQSGCW